MYKAVIVGTSHVSLDSVENVRKSIEKFKPKLVCIELDEKRYHALRAGRKLTLKEALRHGSLFLYLFSAMQQHIGKKTGNKPGIDMIMSVQIARTKKIPVALVDKDIMQISKEIKALPKREKMKLVGALFTGLIVPQKDIDIKKIPSDELIEEALKEVKKISPRFYKVLVTDRNRYMTDMIARAIKQKKVKKTVVVVGAGHKKEIARLLSKKKIKISVV